MQSQSFKLNHKLIRAGAGAGKTTALIDNIYESASSFKINNGRYPRIVVCTFTVKSTKELRDRLIKKAISLNDLDFISFVNDSNKLFVSTIHSLLNYYLKSEASAFNIDPDFNIVEKSDLLHKQKNILFEILQISQNKDLLKIFKFNELFEFCDLLFSYFLRSDLRSIDTKDILNSLEEIKKSLICEINELILDAKYISEQCIKDNIKTEWLNVEKKLKLILSSMVKEECFFNEEKIAIPANRYKEVKEEVNVFKEKFDIVFDKITSPSYSLSFVLENINVQQKVNQVAFELFKSFNSYKLTNSVFTIADLEDYAIYFTNIYKHAAESFSKKWDYWLIDEFQDTSPSQLRILKELIKNNPYFLVGDPQQSIYLFRGSDIGVFAGEEALFANNNYNTETLTTNYRSHPSLLEMINDIFSKLGFLPMQAKDHCIKEYVSLKYGFSSTTDKQYKTVCSEVVKLIEEGESPENICILSRNNIDLKDLSGYFDNAKIPYLLNLSSSFYSNVYIQELLSLLKFVVNPYDNQNLLVLFRSEFFNISDDVIFSASEGPHNSLWLNFLEKKELSDLVDYYKKLIIFSRTTALSDVLKRFIVDHNVLDSVSIKDSSGLSYSNVIKLISIVRQKEEGVDFNIIDFCNKAKESLFDESDAISINNKGKVSLLSVHKSKGLQFKHVFIINSHKPFNTKYYYPVLPVKSKNTFSISTSNPFNGTMKHPFWASESLSDNIEQEKKEYERLFYVAVTRAIDRVYILGNDKIANTSWASMIKVEELEKSSKYTIEKINLDIDQIKQITFINESILDVGLKINSILKNKKHSISNLVNYSVSYSSKDLKKVNDIESIKKSYFGTKKHEQIEKVSYQLKANNKVDIDLKSSEVPIFDILKNGNPEWGFSFKLNDWILEGKIDNWAVIDNCLWILDYKTGSSDYVEIAFEQLNLYSLALRNFLNCPSAKLCVVYTESNQFYTREAKSTEEVESMILTRISKLSFEAEANI